MNFQDGAAAKKQWLPVFEVKKLQLQLIMNFFRAAFCLRLFAMLGLMLLTKGPLQKMRHPRFFITLILILGGFAKIAFAKSHPVIEASLVEFPPTAWSEGTEVKGIYADLLTAIEKRSKLKIAKRVFPLLRAADRIQNSTSDLTIVPITKAFSKIESRRIFLYKHRYYLISRKKDPVCSAAEIHGEIGRLRGGCSDLLAPDKVHFFELSSYEQGLTMLQKGRLNGFCGVEEGLAYLIKHLPVDTSALSKLEMAERDIYIIFSPTFSQAEFEIINQAVKEILKEKELETIQHRYNEPSEFLNKPSC